MNGLGSVLGPQGSTSLDPGGWAGGWGPGSLQDVLPAGHPTRWPQGEVVPGEWGVLGGTEVRWACVEPGNWEERRFTQGDKYIKR